jgi:hypothetical protein
LNNFKDYNTLELFKKCGYVEDGFFDPGVAHNIHCDEIGFEECGEIIAGRNDVFT